MARLAPPIQHFTRRLADCPPEFLAMPALGNHSGVSTAAVVFDLLDGQSLSPSHSEVQPFHFTGEDEDLAAARSILRGVQVTCWLLDDPFFRGADLDKAQVLELLQGPVVELSRKVDAGLFVTDPDRREELSRRCLFALDFRIEGESEEHSRDRLNALDTMERERIMAETRAKLERAEEVRRKLAAEQAREAAARYNRE
jgi:hypothetical protein